MTIQNECIDMLEETTGYLNPDNGHLAPEKLLCD